MSIVFFSSFTRRKVHIAGSSPVMRFGPIGGLFKEVVDWMRLFFVKLNDEIQLFNTDTRSGGNIASQQCLVVRTATHDTFLTIVDLFVYYYEFIEMHERDGLANPAFTRFVEQMELLRLDAVVFCKVAEIQLLVAATVRPDYNLVDWFRVEESGAEQPSCRSAYGFVHLFTQLCPLYANAIKVIKY